MAFTHTFTIRFEHCDPAGIVFYPRYFQMINHMVEVWFEQVLSIPFTSLHFERQLGIPTAHIECDFLKPSRLEDKLLFSLEIEKIGEKALTLQIEAICKGEKRLMVKQVLVFVSLIDAGIHSIPIPSDIRETLKAYSTSCRHLA